MYQLITLYILNTTCILFKLIELLKQLNQSLRDSRKLLFRCKE